MVAAERRSWGSGREKMRHGVCVEAEMEWVDGIEGMGSWGMIEEIS